MTISAKTDIRLGEPLPIALREVFLKALRQVLLPRYVLSRPEELAVYDCDGCTLVTARPDAVVLPQTAAEVSAIIKICLQYNIPYTARGAGTGLSGGAMAMAGGVVIGLNRMENILEIDVEQRTATIESGVVNGWLNQACIQHGLFYAPDPSSQSACTLGGNIAENAGGIHCIKYGMTTDHILALEVVLPNGEITWLGCKSRRQAGPNWVGLWVGSEGTLGIVTRAVVRLLPIAPCTQVYLAAFGQVQQATQTVETIIQSALLPSALEFMDGFTVRAVNEAFSVGFPEAAQAVLLIELSGDAADVALRHTQLLEILTRFETQEVRVGKTEAERLALWKARKGTVAAYGRYAPAFYLHDCVVPRSKLTRILAQISQIAEAQNVLLASVFHAGDGNLHPHILFDPEEPGVLERVMLAGEAIVRACLDAGGVLSGEHGIGIEKSAFMLEQFSVEELNNMAQIKRAIDPMFLANPAKIFPIRKACGETRMMMTHQMLITRNLWV